MYEQFGAVVHAGHVVFNLFFPDRAVDPTQYSDSGGDLPHIATIRVTGSFQSQIDQVDWDFQVAPLLIKSAHPNGWLYSCTLPNVLPDGYYEYKYFVTYEDGSARWCSDPCTKYGGGPNDNSGFAVGGDDVVVQPIGRRLPQRDLIIYELMPDDFTAEFRGTDAPFDAIRSRLDYVQQLGVNAVEFMPWTGWPGGGFNWGYEPFEFFATTYRYTNKVGEPTNKLVRLKWLINELHARNMHVIMDGVFQFAKTLDQPGRGFGYYWLYQDPDRSPYIGIYKDNSYFKPLEFANGCTQQFITDACTYWIDTFQIDGIRFDYTLGYYRPDDLEHGIVELTEDVAAYCVATNRTNFSMMLEHLPDNRYAAIDAVNHTDATGCWFDPFMWDARNNAAWSRVDTELMRVLDASKDFALGKGPVTYIENHDHSSFVVQAGGRNVWWQTQPYAIALLTSPGAVLIHNGQEYGEDYDMPENGPDRVMPRPLRWQKCADDTGQRLLALYRKLIQLRKDHPALRSPNFYPEEYDPHFNQQGYGVDTDRGLVILHRWGVGVNGALERLIIVLNASSADQWVDVPFPANGDWRDLLNDRTDTVASFWLRNQQITSHWGRVYCQP
jgi:1,4-alpha-glucan branching enzyme